MAFPTFPVFYPESALNPYSVPQLLSWMMLRSNFASDFNISFCKSLSVSICSFRAFSFPPSNLVCLDFGTCPRSLFFWNFFPVRPLGCSQTSQKKKKEKIPNAEQVNSLRGGKKKKPNRILSTQKFTLQMLLQISVLTRPAIFPNPVSSFKSTRIYLFLLKLLLLFTHCFASSLIPTNSTFINFSIFVRKTFLISHSTYAPCLLLQPHLFQ